jgi:hypothetical protein
MLFLTIVILFVRTFESLWRIDYSKFPLKVGDVCEFKIRSVPWSSKDLQVFYVLRTVQFYRIIEYKPTKCTLSKLIF